MEPEAGLLLEFGGQRLQVASWDDAEVSIISESDADLQHRARAGGVN